METYLQNAPLILTILLIAICIVYIAMATFFLIKIRKAFNARQLCLLHRFHRYCASVPRNESLPVTAIERILDAVESADTEIDIDQIVIEEIFKTQKGN